MGMNCRVLRHAHLLSSSHSTACRTHCCRWPWVLSITSRASSTTSTASTASTKLDFAAIDAKWQRRWALRQKDKPTQTKHDTSGKPGGPPKNYYVLPMFPYPSGTLHTGHLRVYTIADVIARFRRMQGFSVLHPMGWDAFGLPAENAAIENGVDPSAWTARNIARMKEQLLGMNGDWDWSKEFRTCEPSFYEQTQRIFLLLHRHGLAYRADSFVNYDPVEKTVLANEQVGSDGRSWRSRALVEQRRLKQWFIRLTAFKESLLNDLQLLKDRWPERVVSMQKNWLGKSSGKTLRFNVTSSETTPSYAAVDTFTTRIDTLFGVQYLALSLKHPLVTEAAKSSSELRKFLDRAHTLSPDSKEGFELENLRARNPLASLSDAGGDYERSIPIFAAPYVLGEYGTGATMGVPAHDVRDYEFWKYNCGEKPVRQVVEQVRAVKQLHSHSKLNGTTFTQKGNLTNNCGRFAGMHSDEAAVQISKALQDADEPVANTHNWRIRDWLISRQRYWGTPIPIIHCKSCGSVPVPDEDLPVVLPKVNFGELQGRTGNPLAHLDAWVKVICPQCDGPATRETDTMDTFMDSSWYFFRFPDVGNDKAPFSQESANAHMPVDAYVGGVEHAILHLLYARFISKFLSRSGLWPKGLDPDVRGEPFRHLICQGMVHGRTYSDPDSGRFLLPSEIKPISSQEAIVKATGKKAIVTFEKMSKSKHNGVDPGECIASYGADAARAHMLFQAPETEVLEWDENSIVGIHRWFHKVWQVVMVASSSSSALEKSGSDSELWQETQQTIKSITKSLSSASSLNTVVSDLMKLSNTLAAFVSETKSTDLAETRRADDPGVMRSSIFYQSVSSLIKLMAPVAPAFAEECWETLHAGHGVGDGALPRQATSSNLRATPASVFDELFPTVYEEASRRKVPEKVNSAIQINGRLKFVAKIKTVPEELLEEKGATDAQLREWLREQLVCTVEGKKYLGADGERVKLARRVIVVKGGRVLNFVM